MMRRQDAGGAESPSSRSVGTGQTDLLPMVPHLRAYARSLAAGNVDLADDLVQDTLMLALQAWERFTPGTNLKAWLFQILHNRFCSVVSRRHVRAEIGVDDLSWRASVPAFQEIRPEVREFKLAFARLTPAHREVLVLHAVQGLPYEQIAEICGCEVGTVKSRINRARNVLKQILLGEGGPKQSLHASPRQARTPRKQPVPPPRGVA
jgi:RNA polymerase sigma-70 factor, ECF subfamily